MTKLINNTKMKRVVSILLLSMSIGITYAQQKADTVIVSLGKSSQVILTMKDRSDLEILKQYNFQELFRDILWKLETNDTTALANSSDENDSTEITEKWSRDKDGDAERWSLESRYHEDKSDEEYNTNENHHNEWHVRTHKRRSGRTRQSFAFDLGTNNYLSDGKFPDNDNALHAVRPWGSWYVGINSVQRTRLAKKFFLEWGLGVNWYNFKFQNDNILMVKDDNGVSFVEDPRTGEFSFNKSKLTASYLNASLIPVIDFGDRSKKNSLWNGSSNSFRLGFGPYVGYRIGSYSKVVYEDRGKERERNRDNFYLNNLRYGARLQLGFRSTDLFFNYDLNELFITDKGPNLNAFSFGVIF